MQCVISNHRATKEPVEAITIYLGNALCKHHLSNGRNFVESCKKSVGGHSLVEVLESQSRLT